MKTEKDLKEMLVKLQTEHRRKTKFLQENVIQLNRTEENRLRRDIGRIENEIIDIRNGVLYLQALANQTTNAEESLKRQKADIEGLICKIEKTIDGAVMTTKERLLNKQKQTGALKQKLNTINYLIQ